LSSLIYTMHVSADGYMADRSGDMWPGFGWPPEAHAALTQLYRKAGAVVFGRGTYETVVPFWTNVAEGRPNEFELELEQIHHEFAAVFRPIPKYVVSTTLTDPLPGVHVIREEPVARVAEILAGADGDVLLLAGPRLTADLAAGGLLNEMLFIIGPTVLGAGKPVIHDIGRQIDLRLLETSSYPQHTLINRYAVERGR
jgi:dihydrofolate reductase